MKATTPRWIAFGITCLMAIISLLSNMSQETFIGTAILLVVFFFGMIVGKEKTMISTAPAIALSWILFGSCIGTGAALTIDHLIYALERMTSVWFDGDSPMFIIALAALIAAQIFLRNADHKALIVVRYLVLGFMFFASAPNDPNLRQFLLLIALMNLSFELRTGSADSVRKSRFLASIYLWALTSLTWNLLGGSIYATLFSTANTFSIYVIIGIGVIGGLIIMEKVSDSTVSYLHTFKYVGPILLFWCGTNLITLLMPSLNNLNVSVLVPVVMFHIFHIFLKEWKKIYRSSKEALLFYVIWSLVCVLSLTLSKSIYLGNLLTSIFLAIAPIAAVLCWNISKGKHHETETMVSFLGVCAVIALAVSSNVATDDPALLAVFILTVAILCVFWCLLCGKIYKLHNTASKVDANEFQTLAKLQKYAPLIVLVIALFKILLANPGA